MADFRRIAPLFCAVGIVTLAVCETPVVAQSTDSSELRKNVEQLQTQVKSLQSELDDIKAMLREQSARIYPVIDIGGDPVMGDAGAKLVVMEFSEVNPGKIPYVFAIRVAEAGRCATEQGKFWEMHDQLFAHQRDFATTGIGDAAGESGLNQTQFESCLNVGKYTDAVLQAEAAGAKPGIQGKPAFVFGIPDPANPTKIRLGRAMVGAQPYATFQQTIDGLLPK